MAVSSAPDLGWPVKPAQDHGVCVVAAAGYQPINALLAAAAACMSPRLSWPEAGNEAPGEVATWWVVHFVARTLKEFIFLWPGGWWLVEEKIHPTEHLENKHWRISKTLINEQEGCTRHRAGGSKKKNERSQSIYNGRQKSTFRAEQYNLAWDDGQPTQRFQDFAVGEKSEKFPSVGSFAGILFLGGIIMENGLIKALKRVV